MLITLEGLDGTGKSTLAKRLAEQLPHFTLTKEPGSPLTSIGPQIREIVLNNKDISPLTRELLFYADALEHKNILMGYDHAISDRGQWSHLAYLYGYLKTGHLDWDQYALMKKLIWETCTEPTAVIYIEGDLQLMHERNASKVKDVIESMGTEFYSFVLAAYDDLYHDFKRCSYPVLKLSGRDPVDVNLSHAVRFIEEVDQHGKRNRVLS